MRIYVLESSFNNGESWSFGPAYTDKTRAELVKDNSLKFHKKRSAKEPDLMLRITEWQKVEAL